MGRCTFSLTPCTTAISDPPADLLNWNSTSPYRSPQRPEGFRHRRRRSRLRRESLAGGTHIGRSDISLQRNFSEAGHVRRQRTASVERRRGIALIARVIRFAVARVLLGQRLIFAVAHHLRHLG